MANYIVKNAGTEAVNGTYTEAGLFDGSPYYSRPDGFLIQYFAGEGWFILGPESEEYYRHLDDEIAPPLDGWVKVDGQDPVPTLEFEAGANMPFGEQAVAFVNTYYTVTGLGNNGIDDGKYFYTKHLNGSPVYVRVPRAGDALGSYTRFSYIVKISGTWIIGYSTNPTAAQKYATTTSTSTTPPLGDWFGANGYTGPTLTLGYLNTAFNPLSFEIAGAGFDGFNAIFTERNTSGTSGLNREYFGGISGTGRVLTLRYNSEWIIADDAAQTIYYKHSSQNSDYPPTEGWTVFSGNAPAPTYVVPTYYLVTYCNDSSVNGFFGVMTGGTGNKRTYQMASYGYLNQILVTGGARWIISPQSVDPSYGYQSGIVPVTTNPQGLSYTFGGLTDRSPLKVQLQPTAVEACGGFVWSIPQQEETAGVYRESPIGAVNPAGNDYVHIKDTSSNDDILVLMPPSKTVAITGAGTNNETYTFPKGSIFFSSSQGGLTGQQAGKIKTIAEDGTTRSIALPQPNVGDSAYIVTGKKALDDGGFYSTYFGNSIPVSFLEENGYVDGNGVIRFRFGHINAGAGQAGITGIECSETPQCQGGYYWHRTKQICQISPPVYWNCVNGISTSGNTYIEGKPNYATKAECDEDCSPAGFKEIHKLTSVWASEPATIYGNITVEPSMTAADLQIAIRAKGGIYGNALVTRTLVGGRTRKDDDLVVTNSSDESYNGVYRQISGYYNNSPYFSNGNYYLFKGPDGNSQYRIGTLGQLSAPTLSGSYTPTGSYTNGTITITVGTSVPVTQGSPDYRVTSATDTAFNGAYTEKGYHNGKLYYQNAGGRYLYYNGGWRLSTTLGDTSATSLLSPVSLEGKYLNAGSSASAIITQYSQVWLEALPGTQQGYYWEGVYNPGINTSGFHPTTPGDYINFGATFYGFSHNVQNNVYSAFIKYHKPDGRWFVSNYSGVEYGGYGFTGTPTGSSPEGPVGTDFSGYNLFWQTGKYAHNCYYEIDFNTYAEIPDIESLPGPRWTAAVTKQGAAPSIQETYGDEWVVSTMTSSETPSSESSIDTHSYDNIPAGTSALINVFDGTCPTGTEAWEISKNGTVVANASAPNGWSINVQGNKINVSVPENAVLGEYVTRYQGAFTPQQLGPMMWLDDRGAGTTSWTDSSGSNNSLTTTEGSPVLANGGVVFNGNDIMDGVAAIGSAQTLFIVGSRSANTEPFVQINEAGSSRGVWGFAHPDYAVYSNYERNGVVVNPSDATLNSVGIYCSYTNRSSPTDRVAWKLGQGQPAYTYLNGTIKEIIAFSTVLTTEQRLLVTQYLATKHGITL